MCSNYLPVLYLPASYVKSECWWHAALVISLCKPCIQSHIASGHYQPYLSQRKTKASVFDLKLDRYCKTQHHIVSSCRRGINLQERVVLKQSVLHARQYHMTSAERATLVRKRKVCIFWCVSASWGFKAAKCKLLSTIKICKSWKNKIKRNMSGSCGVCCITIIRNHRAFCFLKGILFYVVMYSYAVLTNFLQKSRWNWYVRSLRWLYSWLHLYEMCLN